MTKDEVKGFMKKIKAYYNYFDIDTDYIIAEWCAKLKDFSAEQIYGRLDRHLKGEYQSDAPKLHYLTMGLKASSEKILSNNDIHTYCNYCKKIISFAELQEHMDKCRSIDYVIRNMKKWYNKEITQESLVELDDEEFFDRYNKLLRHIQKNTNDIQEKRLLENILDGVNNRLDINAKMIGNVYE